jgi:hypothetical protein
VENDEVRDEEAGLFAPVAEGGTRTTKPSRRASRSGRNFPSSARVCRETLGAATTRTSTRTLQSAPSGDSANDIGGSGRVSGALAAQGRWQMPAAGTR